MCMGSFQVLVLNSKPHARMLSIETAGIQDWLEAPALAHVLGLHMDPPGSVRSATESQGTPKCLQHLRTIMPGFNPLHQLKKSLIGAALPHVRHPVYISMWRTMVGRVWAPIDALQHRCQLLRGLRLGVNTSAAGPQCILVCTEIRPHERTQRRLTKLVCH